MMMFSIVRRLISLISGLGLTLIGVGLGGLFFAIGVNTGIAVMFLIVGFIFAIVAFVFDIILDTMDADGRGS